MSFFKEEWRVLTIAALVILVSALNAAKIDRLSEQVEELQRDLSHANRVIYGLKTDIANLPQKKKPAATRVSK